MQQIVDYKNDPDSGYTNILSCGCKELSRQRTDEKIKHESTTMYIGHGFLTPATTPYTDRWLQF